MKIGGGGDEDEALDCRIDATRVGEGLAARGLAIAQPDLGIGDPPAAESRA